MTESTCELVKILKESVEMNDKSEEKTLVAVGETKAMSDVTEGLKENPEITGNTADNSDEPTKNTMNEAGIPCIEPDNTLIKV